MTYLLFSGSRYYPSGGWDDFDGPFDSHEAAREAVKAMGLGGEYNWWHIVNADTRCIVERSE